MILDSFGYLHAPWRRSTKPFTKRLSCCEGKSTCISCFFAVCSPSAQSLTIAYFAWCWAQTDAFTLREDAPQNRLQNSWAVVEVSPLVFRGFLLTLSAKSLTISDVTAWLLYYFIQFGTQRDVLPACRNFDFGRPQIWTWHWNIFGR